jgi:hypothetical protein
MAIKNTFIRRPERLVVFRDATGGTPLNTTTSAALAVGVTTIVLTSGTNAKVGPARINDGEDIERIDITNVAGATITLARPTRRAHAAGVAVVEQVAEDLGDIDGDVTLGLSRESTDQFSAMRFLQFGTLVGNASATLAARLLGTTVENLAFACGIPRSTSIVGTGANLANVKTFTTDFSTVDSVNELSLAVVARRQDSSVTVFEFWGVNMDFTQVSMQLGRAQNGAIPFTAALIGAAAQFDAAPAWTAAQTFRATKGKLFKELTAVGLVTEAAVAATTVGTAAAAGATTLIVADAATISPNDWIVVGIEDLLEVHWVASKVTNTLTLRTPLLRAQAVGVRVIRALRTPFAAVVQGGATFTVGGSTSPLIVENRVLPVGMQPGNAQATTTFSVNDVTLAAVARALGLPASAVSANGLLLTEGMLSAGIAGVYLEGLTVDNTMCILTLWGVTQDLASFSMALGSTTPTALPYSVRPTSGVQFLQYAA